MRRLWASLLFPSSRPSATRRLRRLRDRREAPSHMLETKALRNTSERRMQCVCTTCDAQPAPAAGSHFVSRDVRTYRRIACVSYLEYAISEKMGSGKLAPLLFTDRDRQLGAGIRPGFSKPIGSGRQEGRGRKITPQLLTDTF